MQTVLTTIINLKEQSMFTCVSVFCSDQSNNRSRYSGGRRSFLRYVLGYEYPNLSDKREDEIPLGMNHARGIESDVKRRKSQPETVLLQTLILQTYTDIMRLETPAAVTDGFVWFH